MEGTFSFYFSWVSGCGLWVVGGGWGVFSKKKQKNKKPIAVGSVDHNSDFKIFSLRNSKQRGRKSKIRHLIALQ